MLSFISCWMYKTNGQLILSRINLQIQDFLSHGAWLQTKLEKGFLQDPSTTAEYDGVVLCLPLPSRRRTRTSELRWDVAEVQPYCLIFMCYSLFLTNYFPRSFRYNSWRLIEPTLVLPGLLTDKRYPSVISFSFEGFFLIRAHVEVLRWGGKTVPYC